MIEAKDIGVLFATMRANYGHRWPHSSAEDAEVWLRRLGGFNREDLKQATDIAFARYVDFPPTLGQFTQIIGGPPKRTNNYLPPPKNVGKMPYAEWKKLNGVE